MQQFARIGLIDNLQNPHELILGSSYEAPLERYMGAVGGNNGNLAFVHGAHKIVGPRMTRIGWGWPAEKVREVADVIVISCANQIGAHVDLAGWASALERFQLPVVLLGLGAQTPNYEDDLKIPAGTRRFLDLVKDYRAGGISNIGVRGDFTRSVLEHVGAESLPLGCPSLYISPDLHLGRNIAQRAAARPVERVAVAAGNPYHAGNRAIEAQMIELCDRYNGAYVVQHPDSIVGLTLGHRPEEQKLATLAELLGFSSADECFEWFRRMSYSFHDAQTWMHVLRHYDVALGARYHGVAFAVQTGLSGLVLNIDNRTRELATTTGIPTIPVADVVGKTSAEIVDMATWDAETGAAFDANRYARAAAMREFLLAHGVPPSDQLTAIAAAGSETSAAEAVEILDPSAPSTAADAAEE